MLDPRGNTGVYLLYMFVRICSIMEKSSVGSSEALQKLKHESDGFKITNPTEKELALAILRLPEQLEMAVSDLQINRVCDLVYEIAVKIAEFYAESKVIDSPEEHSRVLLLEATKKVMSKAFDLLGMKTI
jgi:arginyl-tRNA synthetase